ncbi:hypothetical protein E8E14_008552 [Neopestalotiopsis sp. 37M]|nr:hypothetical protein E8E14_008552 [Neopestalotiopsis sp. 37M]
MGLQAGQYSMQCWNSTSNPDTMNRPRLIYQSLKLIRAMQKRFTNGEIAIPSTDIKESRKGIEICILYRPERALFDNIASFLSKTAEDLSLDYRKFVKQEVGITTYFSQQEIDNVSLLDKPIPDDLTEEKVAKIAAGADYSRSFTMSDNWRNSIPTEQRVPPLLIPRTTLQRLHQKEGNDLAAEIRGIISALRLVQDQTKTSWQMIAMIATGALVAFPTIFNDIRHIFQVMIGCAVMGVGPIASRGAVAIIAFVAVSAAIYLTTKDASNVLLVVNDTSSDVLPLYEWIENGERRLVPESIPAAPAHGDFVWCGLFVYTKYKVKSKSLGTYGSAFGVSFKTGRGNFSVGMDCPNSLAGGNNSIEVHNREHAHDACKMALGSGCMHGWSDRPHVDVKIADHWGTKNWGRAIVIRDD